MKKNLQIKVCGMKFTSNREEVEQLPVDYIGYIFYPQSKRYVGNLLDPGLFNSSKNKVAVFVNENIFEIMALAKNLGFNTIQLHGNENPKTCQILKDQGLQIIKAFNLNDAFKFNTLKAWKNSVDYFLFDTKSHLPGGSGQKFNWQILNVYEDDVPFFLSGGITPDDAEAIMNITHPGLFGVDLNSGFEEEPGLKNIEKLKTFVSRIKSEN